MQYLHPIGSGAHELQPSTLFVAVDKVGGAAGYQKGGSGAILEQAAVEEKIVAAEEAFVQSFKCIHTSKTKVSEVQN